MFEPTPETPVEQEVVEPESKKEESKVSFLDNMDYHRMADFYDLSLEERRDQNTAEKLSFMTDWAKEHTKSDERIAHQEALQELKKRLGWTEKGKELIIKLYKYLRLDAQRVRLEREMALLHE